MSLPITVGLDGSRESLAAADWAAREALRRGLPLRLLHAWERQPYTYALLTEPAQQRYGPERVPREASVELRRRHPELRIISDQVAQEPVAALLAAAGQAELLALGSRGLGRIAGFLVGSVALATVAHAPRPVILVRAGAAAEDEHLPDADGLPSTRTQLRDVVLGVDLTHPCDTLLEFAFDAAARRAATLRVIHGWSFPPMYEYTPGIVDPGVQADLEAREMRALADALRSWRSKFPEVEVDEQAVMGRAAHHLVDAASGAGLMVVGRRTRRQALGTHIGPVTHAVLHHAACPVAVVPHE